MDDKEANIRAEYIEVSNNLRAGVTICWEAFKTYFTVTGLLFATLAFLHGKDATLEPLHKWLVSTLIAFVGLGVTGWGWPAIKRITAYQRMLLARGVELEVTLETSLMTKCWGLFDDGKAGHDDLTFIVFLMFGGIWLVALVIFALEVFAVLGWL